MITERNEFTGAEGQRLVGRLDKPPGDIRAYALFAHCFTCGKDVLAATRLSQAQTQHGIAVLRFDFTGLGESEGDFSETNFSSSVADLIAAANHLRRAYRAPALLIGHSLGGAAVLAAAHDIHEVRAVVTIGAPSDPVHVAGLFSASEQVTDAQGDIRVQIAGRPFRIKRQFLADISRQNQTERIARLRRALLVMHSPNDEIVDIANAMHIFTAARHPKSFVSLVNADHLLTHRGDVTYAANVIAAWSSLFIDGHGEAGSALA
jgi:putative redox protein